MRSSINSRFISVVFLVLNCSWLLAPALNHSINLGPNLVSEYEALNMPYSEWFRLFDSLAMVCLLVGIARYKYNLRTSYGKFVLGLLLSIPILLLVDDMSAITCSSTIICTPVHSPAALIHAVESFLLGLIIIVASLLIGFKRHRLLWVPIAQFLNVVVGLAIHNKFPQYLFALQTIYILIQTYWIWAVVFEPAWRKPIERTVALRIHFLVAVFAAISGLLSIGTTLFHYKVNDVLGDALLTADTAWLDQHAIIVGLTLLFIARNLLKGSKRAHTIALIVTLIELVNYSGLEPLPVAVIAHGLLLVLLIVTRPAFDQQSSNQRMAGRIEIALGSIMISILVFTILSVGFRFTHLHAWENSAFTAGRVVQRMLLLEVTTDPADPLRARLFSQVLTAGGIFMYGWILTSLFLPTLLENNRLSKTTKLLVEDLLKKHSRSSEDYFKLWPEDKQYWFNHDKTGFIAYKVSGNYAFALQSPVCQQNNVSSMATEFMSYCRASGWQAVWLMSNQVQTHQYTALGLNGLAIGASAIVDISKFNMTVRNKWWRWARNKATKSGLTYKRIDPPINPQVVNELSAVSRDWLSRDNHAERGFALGYFDKHMVSSCVIHSLVDNSGNIVAFANQLPSFNNATQFTIDLMRFRSNYDHSMALLLSEIICNTPADAGFKTFDLGFVPLAHTTSSGAELLKKILKPVFSFRGLRQFKNKFEPTWETNYIAWEGTYLDIPAIATSLQRAITIKDN